MDSDKKTRKHHYSEAINNEIITNNIEIPSKESYWDTIEEFYIKNNCKDNDPEFWKTYNYLPDDKLKQRVLENIENQKKKK